MSTRNEIIAKLLKTIYSEPDVQLIKKEEPSLIGGKYIWTELPDGKKHGLWQQWDGNNKLVLEENYLFGKLYGHRRTWFEDSGRLRSQTLYQDGKKHGCSYGWNKDGQHESEERYFEDQKHGNAKSWYGSGQLYTEWNFTNGLADGICRRWYHTGQLQSVENYSFGERHGLCQYWGEDGRVDNICYYNHGKLTPH